MALLSEPGVSGVSAGTRGAQETLHQERERPEARRPARAVLEQEEACTSASTGEEIYTLLDRISNRGLVIFYLHIYLRRKLINNKVTEGHLLLLSHSIGHFS